MGRSLYRPTASNTVEDYRAHNRFYHRASDRYYTMVERNGQWFQQRHQIGFGGKETNVVEMQIDYVIGSGNHARGYLHRAPDGRLLELPVSWYTESGGYWAMSPGYDRAGQQDFRRAIGFNCVFCHDGYPNPAPAADSPFSEPVFGERIPEGIDCQRCHGPGGTHVATAGSGKANRDAIRRTIVNPARLSRDRQLEICMQCHLEPTSRPLPNVVSRFGRSPFAYRPGDPLADYFLYFDHAPGAGQDDKFEIAHAAYRLRKSKCFQASQMTCSTCHNPHDIPRGGEAVARYAAACRSCHAGAHPTGMPAGANCMECHMPRRRTDDAVHVVLTDHYIQRRKPAGDLLGARQEKAEGGYRGEVVPYYPERSGGPDDELYFAVAQVRDGSNLGNGIVRLRATIERYKPAAPEFYLELGKAYSRTGNPQEAILWCDEALRRRAGFRPALKELGVALIAAGHLPRAAEVLQQAADPVALTNLGNVYLRLGQTEAAGRALEQALRANPDAPDAHNLLGMLWSQKGDRAASEQHFRRAIALAPDLAEAHHNLANLLASGRDYAQAAYHFEKAIAINPAYVEAHHRYGLLLLAMGSNARAQNELEATVRLSPSLAQAHSDLADVLAAKGRIDAAVAEYRRAIQCDENLYEAHLALGLLLRGKTEARAHLEKAAQSGDEAVREAARKALR